MGRKRHITAQSLLYVVGPPGWILQSLVRTNSGSCSHGTSIAAIVRRMLAEESLRLSPGMDFVSIYHTKQEYVARCEINACLPGLTRSSSRTETSLRLRPRDVNRQPKIESAFVGQKKLSVNRKTNVGKVRVDISEIVSRISNRGVRGTSDGNNM